MKRNVRKFFRCLFLIALAFSLLCGSVHGEFLAGLLSGETNVDRMEAASEEIDMWRSLIESLPEDKPEYAPTYTFWWGNLDSEPSYELIVRVMDPQNMYWESLLVYDKKEDGGKMEPELLFETAPYVQIRSSFAGNADNDKMLFSAVSNMYDGECVEGNVCLNGDKTDLEYTVTRTYSMAENETASSGMLDIDGYYDGNNPEATDWGPLEKQVLMHHDFILGEDNNWFAHSIGTDSRSGFTGLEALEVTDEHYDILTAGAGAGLRSDIDDTIEGSFGGVCLGLSSMIGHVQAGSTAVTEFQADAEHFFDLGKPNENEALFEHLSYLQLLQQRLDKEEDYDGFVHYRWFQDESPDLRALIEAISGDKWQLLTFLTAGSGHALLLTDLVYYPFRGLYQLTFYDVNSIDEEESPQGKTYSMFVKDDFTAFTLQDGNGEQIDESNCVELSLIDTDVLLRKEAECRDILAAVEQVKDEAAAELNNAQSILSFTPAYEIFCQALEDKALSYEDGVLYWDGTENPVLPGIVNATADGESRSYCRAVLPASGSYTLRCDPAGTDFSLQTADGYCSVSGTGIETVSYSEEEGLTLTGDDAVFEAALCIGDGDGSWLGKVSGSGSGSIRLFDAGGTLQMDAENPVRLEKASVVHGTDVTHLDLSQDTATLTLSEDGSSSLDGEETSAPTAESAPQEAPSQGNTTLVVILVAAILVLAASLLSFFLMKRKR